MARHTGRKILELIEGKTLSTRNAGHLNTRKYSQDGPGVTT